VRDSFHGEFISFGVECVPEEIMAAGTDTVLADSGKAGRTFHFQSGIARPGLITGSVLNGHGCEISIWREVLMLGGAGGVSAAYRALHDLGETVWKVFFRLAKPKSD